MTLYPSQILAWHHEFLCIFRWSRVRTFKASRFRCIQRSFLNRTRQEWIHTARLRKGLRISPASGGHQHTERAIDHLSRDSWLIRLPNALFTDFSRLSYQVRVVSECRHSMGSRTNQFTLAALSYKLTKLDRHSIHIKHSSFTFLHTPKVAKLYLFENWFLNCCWTFKSEICTRLLIAGGEVIR